MNDFQYFKSSVVWVVGSKIIDALIRFFAIPILIGLYGKNQYGVLVLVMSINAYAQFLDMGINTGAVNYYSRWIAEKKYQYLERVARTSITFYMGIGLINTVLILCLYFFGDTVFGLSKDNFYLFKKLILYLIPFGVMSWVSMVFIQLLISDRNIKYVHKIKIYSAVFHLLIIYVVHRYEYSIYCYYAFFLVSSVFVIFPLYIKCNSSGLLGSIRPALYFSDFSIVLKYSVSIFLMGFFQFIATKSRPLVLSAFSTGDSAILADYNVVEAFPLFIVSICSMMISIMMPKTSKAVYENNKVEIDRIAYEGTKYSTVLVSLLCFPVMINAVDIIIVYVGGQYVHLYQWLIVWLIVLLLFLHNTPIASLVLSTGKTRVLVFSSAFASFFSIIINAGLVDRYGVGAAVIGYGLYIVIQMLVYYLYYIGVVLKLSSKKVFYSFFLCSFPALLPLPIVYLLGNYFESIYLRIFIKSFLWFIVYFALLVYFDVVDLSFLKRSLKFKGNNV